MQEFNLFIAEKFYYLFLGILAAYIIIRMKNKHSIQKRKAVFTVAIGVFLIYTVAILPIQGLVPQWATLVFIALILGGVTYFLRRQWIFKRSCAVCGKKLDWNTTIMDDRNTCADCLAKAEEAAAPSEGSEEAKSSEIEGGDE